MRKYLLVMYNKNNRTTILKYIIKKKYNSQQPDKKIMLYYNSSSPFVVLMWTRNFIIQLKNIAPQFCLIANEINNLELASIELEALLDQKKLNKPRQQTAKTEINRCVKNALISTTALINSLRKNSNWTGTCDKALQIHLLPRMADFNGMVWKQKTGHRVYDNNDCLRIMDWLKTLRHEFKEIGSLHWASRTNSGNLEDIIEKAETVLQEYTSVRSTYETLSNQIENTVQTLQTSMRTIVKHLKASEGWTKENTMQLNIYRVPRLPDFINFKPAAQLIDCVDHVRINFSKTGISGINIYSRLQGEIDFSFLGYAKRTKYKDPRPINPYVSETREYRLNAVVAGNEIGQTSDVFSIKIGTSQASRT